MKKLKNIFKTTAGKIVAVIIGLILLYFFAKSYEREKAISNIITKIRSDQAWLGMVQEKAENNGISLNEQLRKDALYLLNTAQEYKNQWWNQ